MRFSHLWICLLAVSLTTACSTSKKHDQHGDKTAKKSEEMKQDDKTAMNKKDKEKHNESYEKLEGDVAFGCKVGSDMRLVSIKKMDNRCEVYYQKQGDIQQVGWGESNPSICDDVKNKIKGNIEGAGFTCDLETAQNYLKEMKDMKAEKMADNKQ